MRARAGTGSSCPLSCPFGLGLDWIKGRDPVKSDLKIGGGGEATRWTLEQCEALADCLLLAIWKSMIGRRSQDSRHGLLKLCNDYFTLPRCNVIVTRAPATGEAVVLYMVSCLRRISQSKAEAGTTFTFSKDSNVNLSVGHDLQIVLHTNHPRQDRA